MNILVVGKGARELAITKALSKSKELKNIYITPGNAGVVFLNKISGLNIKQLSIGELEFQKLADFTVNNKIDFVILGAELPIAKGLTDYLEGRGVSVIAPNSEVSVLESDKLWARYFAKKYDILVPRFIEYDKTKSLSYYIDLFSLPIVLKEKGLKGGKGVYILNDEQTLKEKLEQLKRDGRDFFLEEYIEGEEFSYFIMLNKDKYIVLPSAKDFKRLNAKGFSVNTGGMGAYSKDFSFNESLKKDIKGILENTVNGLLNEGFQYRGFLYFGLIKKDNLIYLLEYNVRLGDPEAQVILPRLEDDFFSVLNYFYGAPVAKPLNLSFKKNLVFSLVIAQQGYPLKSSFITLGTEQEFYNKTQALLENGVEILHAGTELSGRKLIATGGRVLNLITEAENLKIAKGKIKSVLKSILWETAYYRDDLLV